MSQINIIAQSNKDTVVTEYKREKRTDTAYQSEQQLENDFIQRLVAHQYENIKIKNEIELKNNLRLQLEKLNNFSFLDDEWEHFFNKQIANNNDGIIEKTRKIQDDNILELILENGTSKNITLIDKKNIHNNSLQVLNQYQENSGTHKTRYDVTILVNGLPLIHVELKRRGVAIREAFNQINRYQRDSFWAGSALFEYIQIFVISNGTHTKYYSNTTRDQFIKSSNENNPTKKKKTSNSFEFTSYWADANNAIIPDLIDFTKTFFAKHTILNILTKYCVFTSEKLLLVMRPYQIVATERILNRIEISTNSKTTGTIDAGGYIWHTTGSGKTLTSFKTAQLATQLPYIKKVLFVVDRKDLDYQTMKEYDRFEKGAANSNTSTTVLTKQLGNPNTNIIITTIQKLARFVGKNKTHEILTDQIVIIFDECHRSQFGDMHKDIAKAFKNYHLFGFTGTPIFAKNAGHGKNQLIKTTEQAFGQKLHTYTIMDAINDDNVLKFRISYTNTMKIADKIIDKKVKAIDIDRAMIAPKRITAITSYILEHFNHATYRNQSNSYYSHKVIANVDKMATSKNNTVDENKQDQTVNGFNSIFAVASIDMAKAYYNEFKRQMEEDSSKKLNIATIFSYNPNEEEPDTLADESFETEQLDKLSREFLTSAIEDYNKTFNVSYDTSQDKFPNYYKDVSLRMKNRQIDLLIVVNMFLTGFDATTLNTLWVDKNLRYHGLLQSFSRTNRILNSIKTFGNIICFRNLETQVKEALALFGDKEASGIVLLKSYEEYLNGYKDSQTGNHVPGYIELIDQLKKLYPLNEPIIGEEMKKEFVQLFSAILRIRNILSAFDEFIGNKEIDEIDLQDYQSRYIDIYKEFTSKDKVEKENIDNDIVFEIDLVKQIEVNIDYIIMLIAKYHASNCSNQVISIKVQKMINSSVTLRSKKELIEDFISRINDSTENISEEWHKFVNEEKERELLSIIETENLKHDEVIKFINNAFNDGAIRETGTDIDKILPPISRFTGGNRAEIKQTVISKLQDFFEKYFGIV